MILNESRTNPRMNTQSHRSLVYLAVLSCASCAAATCSSIQIKTRNFNLGIAAIQCRNGVPTIQVNSSDAPNQILISFRTTIHNTQNFIALNHSDY